MRELDKVTEGYLQLHYGAADDAEQQAFQQLLELPDPELLALLYEQQSSPNAHTDQVLAHMRALNLPIRS